MPQNEVSLTGQSCTRRTRFLVYVTGENAV